MKIGQIGERALALEGEMDHTGSQDGKFILKITLKVKTMIGLYAMKEMPTTKEMINQINLDKDVTIHLYEILAVPNN